MPLTKTSTPPPNETVAASSLPSDVNKLTGAQKAATLLIALGVETAGQILRKMDDDDVEKVSIEIARLRNVSSDLVEGVLLEYRDMAMARDYIGQGGVPYARDVLQTALGPRRADEIMMRVEAAMEVSAFHLLQTVETFQLTSFLQKEHPQTAALILAHLNPRKAADIVSSLPFELKNEVMYRLATMGKTSPEMLNDIEDVIRNQLGSLIGAEMSVTGGAGQVAEILNLTSRAAERSILDNIRERSDELATSIKALMFVFDDLQGVSAPDLQRLLMDVDQRDLALSLKTVSDELKEKILRNVSERVAVALNEEIDLLGRVRVSDVDEAQQRILEVAQQLEADEEIVLSRSDEDAVI